MKTKVEFRLPEIRRNSVFRRLKTQLWLASKLLLPVTKLEETLTQALLFLLPSFLQWIYFNIGCFEERRTSAFIGVGDTWGGQERKDSLASFGRMVHMDR